MPAPTKADGSSIKLRIKCVNHIKHQRTAVHIETSYQYANERAVLIMPYTIYRVKKMNQIKSSYLSKEQTMKQIQLEECHQYSNT